MSQAVDTLLSKEQPLTTHEVLTSLVWLIAGSYAVYLAWFGTRTVKSRFRDRDTESSER